MKRHESDLSEEEAFAPTPDGAPAPAGRAPEDASGAVRYDIVRLLAEGGMGSVFLARDPSLGREVALKGAKGDDPTRRARFLDEMRILGQLEHPNVVPLHALVVADRAPFCTMRYVRGRTLAEVLGSLRAGDAETATRYSVTRLVQVLLQVSPFARRLGVVARTCLKALAKSPEARHASVRELQGEIQAWLEAEADKVKGRRKRPRWLAAAARRLHGRPRPGLPPHPARRRGAVGRRPADRSQSLRPSKEQNFGRFSP